MSDPVVMMRHVRSAGICSRGARAWFQKHDLDWNVFLSEGLQASVIEATECPIAARAVAKAREEQANG